MTDEFAFWAYDTYPYVLGGTVVSRDAKGYVRTKEYGGFRFKPQHVVSVEDGKNLLAKLEGLQAAKREAINSVNEDFWNRLQALKAEAGWPEVTA